MTRRIDFDQVNRAALARLDELLARWLPGGRWAADEYVVINPKRADRRPGSFKINRNGSWADFATGDRGRDPIALAAYLFDLSQFEAASRLAAMLGIGGQNGHRATGTARHHHGYRPHRGAAEGNK